MAIRSATAERRSLTQSLHWLAVLAVIGLAGTGAAAPPQAPASQEARPAAQPDAAAPTDVPGVAGGKAGRGPTAAMAEDARLARHIKQQLAWDRELAPFDLHVRVEHAVVHLSGQVATMAQSHRARRLSEAIPGANAVVNATYVDPALAVARGNEPLRPDDATLRRRVEQTLERDASVNGADIQPAVENGTVTLVGTVSGFGAKEKAVRVVRDLYGVGRVVDELAVDRDL